MTEVEVDNIKEKVPGVPKAGSPLRAVLVGLALVPFTVFWLLYMEMVTNPGGKSAQAGPFPTSISIFANVIFIVFFLTLLNRFIARWINPLTSRELLIIYVMLTVASTVASLDFLAVLVPMLPHAHYFATPENGWAVKFLDRLPTWAVVTDTEASKGWYLGNSTLYTLRHILAWGVPVAAWGGFITVLLFVMFCMNTILRKQWTENEKLLFPMTQLPIELTDTSGRLLGSKTMWYGFAIAASISLLNGVHYLAPAVPWINVKLQDMGQHFILPPWNAMGWTPISFYPFAIGLGYLLPTDLLFSSWFFYFFWKAEKVLSACYGLNTISPRFPYVAEQCLGAYLQVAVFAVYLGRRHFAEVFRRAIRGGDSDDGPMSYRMAVFGGLIGLVLLCGFFTMLGLSWWLAILSFALYIALAIGVTRMRSELGPPSHDLHGGGPDSLFPILFGTAFLGPQNAVGLTFFWWFNRAYRSMPVAYQLEGMKIAERSGTRQRHIALAIGSASILALICGFWAYLHYGYERGASTRMAGHVVWFGWEAFGRLDGWISAPRGPDYGSGAAVGIGFIFASLLWGIRFFYTRSPFHPLGVAVSGTYAMETLWLPMLIAWLAKSTTLKIGGLQSYRRALPFFLGLILGDYVMGCMWPILGWITGVTMYSFQQ